MTKLDSNSEYLLKLQNYQAELEFQNEQLRQTQLELQISKQEYQELYDLAPVGYLLLNENGLILKANLTSAGLFGIERGKIVQTLFTKMIFSEDQDLFYRHRKHLLRTKRKQVLELKLIKFESSFFWASLESTYAYDLGEHSIFRIVITDITLRKNAELKTLEEQGRFANLIYALNQSAIVSILNTDGNLIFVNDKFCQLAGHSREELLGVNNHVFRSIFHEDDFFVKLPTLLSENNIWKDVICKNNNDGSPLWLDCTITLVPENIDEARYISIYYDITARKHAEHLLVNSSRMASLGEMASGIAHEINNPLAIITGKTNQIKRLFKESILNRERIIEEIQKIESTSFRISKIVKSLRLISRNADNDSFETISLKSVIMDTLELCTEKFKQNCIDFEINNILGQMEQSHYPIDY